MKSLSVLLVEDNDEIATGLRALVELEGLSFIHANTGQNGLIEARQKHPSLIILDLGLPDMSGIEVCRKLKDQPATKSIPIIFLSGKTDETDIVVGLELGAEDYVKKPFGAKELVARIHSVLRRGSPRLESQEQLKLECGSIAMDRSRFEVCVENRPVSLTLAEFQILWALMERPGLVLSRDQLLSKIGTGESDSIDRVVDVHISSIRKQLGNHGRAVVTVRGLGYKFNEEKVKRG